MIKKLNIKTISFLITLFIAIHGFSLAQNEQADKKNNDYDITKDDHYREEYGVNLYTTPSIQNLFKILETIGQVPYNELKREGMISPPRERSLVALCLGTIIAEGFLIIHAEKYSDLEGVARDLIDHTHLLGASSRVKSHAREIQRRMALEDKKNLKIVLQNAQNDVENEMLLLRNIEIAHLISLGGWIRAFEIASKAVMLNYSQERSRVLNKQNLTDYFKAELITLMPKIGNLKFYNELLKEIENLSTELKKNQIGTYTKEQVEKLHQISKKMATIIRTKKN